MSKYLPSKLGHVGRLLFALALTMSVLAGLGLAGQERVSAQGEVVSVDPTDQEVSRGETFTVDVMISGAENLTGYEFTLAFDPELVEVQDVEDASFLGSTGRTVVPGMPQIDDEAGTLFFGAVSTGAMDGPDGSGALATVTFKAIGQGTSPLDLQGVSVFSGGDERDPTVEGGSVSSVFAMAIDPEESVVNPGTFTVDVVLHGALDLTGYEFNVSFDPDVVEVDSVVDASFLGSTGRTVVPGTAQIDNEAGTLFFGAVSTGAMDGPDGDGVLATITFDAISQGESDLDLSGLQTFSGGTPETPDDMDGKVYVVNAGVSVVPEASSVSNCDTFEVELALGGEVTDVTGFDINLDWDATLFQVTDIAYAPYLESTGRTAQELAPTIDNATGTLNYAVATVGTAAGPDAPGVLAVVELQAVGVGTSDLDLHDVLISQSGFDVEPAALNDGTAESTPEAVGFEFSTIEDQVAGQPFNVTITAVDEFGDPAAHFEGDVTLSDDTGTLTPTQVEFVDGTPAVTAPMTITDAEEGITITAAGTNPCDVTFTGESNAFTVEADVESPDPATAVLTPDPETVTAGDSVTYTLMVDDVYGNPFHAEDLATFGIDAEAGGTFDGNVYTSEVAGIWTVTADYLTVSEDATLTVEADEENPISVTIDPAEVTIMIGECVTFDLTAEDSFGNTFDVTDYVDTTFTVDGGGTMTDDEFCSDDDGEWTVTGTYLGESADATVTVELYHLFMPVIAKNAGS